MSSLRLSHTSQVQATAFSSTLSSTPLPSASCLSERAHFRACYPLHLFSLETGIKSDSRDIAGFFYFSGISPPTTLPSSTPESAANEEVPLDYSGRCSVNMSLLEIACFNVQSGVIAARNGASRIELCKDEHLGGTTPLLSDFQALRSRVSIPIYVMIRPRGGNFEYTDPELIVMSRSIKEFDDAGADGFVFGALDDTKCIDQDTCGDLQWITRGKPCTFHRAFDQVPPEVMAQELEALVQMGFRSVLTSGGGKDAVEGEERLKKLVEQAGNRIEVIVGGGVRGTNVEVLKHTTRARWFHSSAIVNDGGVASDDEVRSLRELLDN
jgi:copper homeostasis protein